MKICGVTTVENAREVADCGVDAIGVNLAHSVRRVTRERAQDILDSLQGSILRTLVFAENSDEEILDCVRELEPDVVQLHGPLSDRLGRELRKRPVRVVKALNIEGGEFDSFVDASVDAVLLDGPRSGSGLAHSWDRLASRSFVVPVIAAGGLRAHNVAEVIVATNAWGVDCASGVEADAGVKSPAAVRDFVARARHAWGAEEGA